MNEPEITYTGVLDMQVCVPEDFNDNQVIEYANKFNPTGIESKWEIRKTGNPRLGGCNERVKCSDKNGFVHIMLEC